MDLAMMALHQYVVGNFLYLFQLLEDVVLQDALQNQGEQNQVVHLPYLDVVRLCLVVVEVDAERRHLLKKDCYQDAELLELLVLEPPALPMPWMAGGTMTNARPSCRTCNSFMRPMTIDPRSWPVAFKRTSQSFRIT